MESKWRRSSRSSKKHSPSALKACSDGPPPIRSRQELKRTRQTSSTYGGESTHVSLHLGPSLGIALEDVPRGSRMREGSAIGSFPWVPKLGTLAGSSCIGSPLAIGETSSHSFSIGGVPMVKQAIISLRVSSTQTAFSRLLFAKSSLLFW